MSTLQQYAERLTGLSLGDLTVLSTGAVEPTEAHRHLAAALQAGYSSPDVQAPSRPAPPGPAADDVFGLFDPVAG